MLMFEVSYDHHYITETLLNNITTLYHVDVWSVTAIGFLFYVEETIDHLHIVDLILKLYVFTRF
jgi:hypothetical protein